MKPNMADQNDLSTMSQKTAYVKAITTSGFILRSEKSTFIASKAFSCVYTPQIDDKVAYLVDEYSHIYISIILERKKLDCVKLEVPQGLEIVSSDNVTIQSKNLTLRNRQLFAMNEQTVLASSTVEVQSNAAHLTSNIVEVFGGRLMLKLISSLRFIEKCEHIKAGEVIYRIKNMLKLHGKRATLSADKDVRIEGERVHTD